MRFDREPAEDRALVVALQAGDPGASRHLVDRYSGVLFGLCLRMLGHRQDAEDVLQETLVRALRGIRGFEAGRALRPWLLGIAANRCRTALARRRRLTTSAAFDAESAVDTRPPAAGFAELAAELDRALATLRSDYRRVFVLFHERGLPYEEIARELGRPIGTVKTWLHRAREALAEELSRRGIGT